MELCFKDNQSPICRSKAVKCGHKLLQELLKDFIMFV